MPNLDSFTSSSNVVTSTEATLTDGKLHSFTSSALTVLTPSTWVYELQVDGEITTIPYFQAPTS